MSQGPSSSSSSLPPPSTLSRDEGLQRHRRRRRRNRQCGAKLMFIAVLGLWSFPSIFIPWWCDATDTVQYSSNKHEPDDESIPQPMGDYVEGSSTPTPTLIKDDHDASWKEERENSIHNQPPEGTLASSMEEETASVSSPTSSIDSDNFNIQSFVLTAATDLKDILGASRISGSALVVVVAYRDNCEHSMEFLWKLQYAIRQLGSTTAQGHGGGRSGGRGTSSTAILRAVAPIFVQMPVNPDNVSILDQFGLTHVPVLFFMKQQGFVSRDRHDEDDDGTATPSTPFIYTIPYRGMSSTVNDLYRGLLHYLIRMRHSQMGYGTNTVTGKEYVDAMTLRVASPQELQDEVLSVYGADLIFHRPPFPLDPDFSDDEKRWIRYMMDDEDNDPGDDSSRKQRENDNGHRSNEDNDSLPPRGKSRDPFFTICQCRKQRNPSIPESEEGAPPIHEDTSTAMQLVYREFDQAANILSERRDVLFCVFLDECGNQGSDFFDDGDILAFTVNPDSDRMSSSSSSLRFETVFHPTAGFEEERDTGISKDSGILDFITTLLRPTLLWLDRKMTGPIAFHPRHRLHAVLFVDFHSRQHQDTMKGAIQMFRTACERRRQQERLDGKQDTASSIVCLVVPSTDTRVLTTFGIDIWTPLDDEARKVISSSRCRSAKDKGNGRNGSKVQDEADRGIDNENVNDKLDCRRQEDKSDLTPMPVLPKLLVTERRDGFPGIRRYYLDPPLTDASIETFLTDIIAGRARPDIKSSKGKSGRKVATNSHGIHILTAHALPNFLDEHRHTHVLIQVYAPTCGHCKRFNIIWNSLGDLVDHLGWNDLLVLARLDVTANEVTIPGMTTEWLPDLFYFGVNVVDNPIHYEKTTMAIEVEFGGISDPLDLLDWWMDEAGDAIDVAGLLAVLEETEPIVDG